MDEFKDVDLRTVTNEGSVFPIMSEIDSDGAEALMMLMEQIAEEEES